MSHRTRIHYTAEQKAERWDRWQRGESLKAIGRVFDRPSSSIFGQLSPTGGIRPPPRKRSRLALTLSEREEISRGIASNLSLRTIAEQLGRSPSTISRELKRNGGTEQYRANRADEAAWNRSHRPKSCKLVGNELLRRNVATKLKSQWSPEQIAGWLKREHLGDESNQVSHETIYRSLYIQTRGVLKKELLQYLRSERMIRRSKHSTQYGAGCGRILNAVSISERPAAVEDRAVPGHWEGDLIVGTNSSYIAPSEGAC
jgi:IS30 family transposase